MKSNKDRQLLGLLAKNVGNLRKLTGLSQEELAFQCDIDRTYVSKIERGIANPSLLILLRIADVLKVEIKDLLRKK